MTAPTAGWSGHASTGPPTPDRIPQHQARQLEHAAPIGENFLHDRQGRLAPLAAGRPATPGVRSSRPVPAYPDGRSRSDLPSQEPRALQSRERVAGWPCLYFGLPAVVHRSSIVKWTTMTIEPMPTSYVALDLLTWHEQGSLTLSPKFQRRPVWQPAARSYFIDTLLRGYPVPPIHIRLISEPKKGAVREVVDGQQRMRALFDFIAGKFRLGRQTNAPWAGLTYSQLSASQQEALQMYKFYVYQYQNVTDQTILEIFSRINTYSVVLNKQELRNGRYFGYFKSTVYQLGLDYLNFWRSARIFTERAIARMQEAELTSELLILQLDGIQDKKISIDEFYLHLDDEWGEEPNTWSTRRGERPAQWLSRREAEQRFRNTIDALSAAVGDLLPESEFTRTPLFYTLYAVVYHRLYGLPGASESSPNKPLDGDSTIRLREAVEILSGIFSEDIPETDKTSRDFIVASGRQTDNLAPRLRRFQILWGLARLSHTS
jgi:hypothetical protein